MTQVELERELAAVTGESLSEIRRRGFSLVEVGPEPQSIDWDELYPTDRSRVPLRRRRRRSLPSRGITRNRFLFSPSVGREADARLSSSCLPRNIVHDFAPALGSAYVSPWRVAQDCSLQAFLFFALSISRSHLLQ